MTFATRITALFAAVAVAVPASLPLAPAAFAYDEFCVRHAGAFLANIHVEFKDRSGGPDYADPNARKEFGWDARSVHIAKNLATPGVREKCWSVNEVGRPRPGETFSVRVGAVLGKTTYCGRGNNMIALDDSGNQWHKIHTWPSHKLNKLQIDINGATQSPKCVVSSFIVDSSGATYPYDYIWDGCLQGSEGFRRAGCYAWRPRFKGPDIDPAAANGRAYYFDYNEEDNYDVRHGRVPIPLDASQVAYYFTEKGKLAHLASVARRGADLSVPGAGGTPLQMAVERGRPDLARVLLGVDPHVAGNSPQFRKADVNAIHGGKTALHMAVRRGIRDLDASMVRLLVEEGGADPNIPGDAFKWEDAGALTPLETVFFQVTDPKARPVQDAMFQTMVHAGGDTYADMALLRLAIAGGVNPGMARHLFHQNLAEAMRRGDAAGLEALARMTNESQLQDGFKIQTYWLHEHPAYGGVAAIVRVFQLDFPEGAVPLSRVKGLNLEATDAEGRRPLHLAAMHGSAAAVRALTEKGADVNAKWEGRTPLQVAAAQNSAAALSALLDAGADTSATDGENRTALDLAVLGGHPESETALLAVNAPRGTTTERDRAVTREVGLRGGTILHMVAEEGDARRLRSALKLQPLVNDLNDAGETPLMRAMLANPPGLKEVVDLLLRSGADPNIGAAGEGGNTPASLATSRNQAEILDLLLQYGVSPDGVNPYRNDLPLAAHAVFADAARALRVLIEHGAEINGVRADGRAALGASGERIFQGEMGLLHHGAYSNHADSVRELLHNGAEAGPDPSDGVWPARRAMERGNDAALAEFCARRANTAGLPRRLAPTTLRTL